MAISILLFVFGANLTVFAARVWKHGTVKQAENPDIKTDSLPSVTVQLPIYNELYVAERVILAAAALNYPSHLLEIQVLDDSDDETVLQVSELVEDLARDGLNIRHIRRDDRSGYKAGALANGMQTAQGEFLAVFDADFVPPADFLLQTIGDFEDSTVAFVQARWGHLNRDFSAMTHMQSLAIDGHFLVEQSGRGLRGYWFNFNGTCGVWRADAIMDAGGWTADTLTEDLDLSYRAHLKGWRGVYREDVEVPGELPAHMSGFRRQQHRWARGSLECARKLLGQVWRSPTGAGVKFQATAHLCAYGIHLLLFSLTLIYPLVVLATTRFPGVSTLFGAGYLFATTSFAPLIFFITGQRQLGGKWKNEIPRIGLVTVLGSALMLNTVRAAVQIWTKPDPEFERTAKFGLDMAADGTGSWARKRYQLGFDRIVYAEFALSLYSFATTFLALQHRNFGVMLYSFVFGSGLFGVACLTVTQRLAVRKTQRLTSTPEHAPATAG